MAGGGEQTLAIALKDRVIKGSVPWSTDERCIPYNGAGPCVTWELVKDPSDSMIIGGRFSRLDIVDSRGVIWNCWVPGTRFRNIRSGRVMVVFEMFIHKLKSNGMPCTMRLLRWKEVKRTKQMEML